MPPLHLQALKILLLLIGQLTGLAIAVGEPKTPPDSGMFSNGPIAGLFPSVSLIQQVCTELTVRSLR